MRRLDSAGVGMAPKIYPLASNRCMSKLLPIVAPCLIASVFAVTLAAQRGTDFSGSWVLDETQVHPAPDIPQRLVIEQPLRTTNMLGAPMPPAYLTLNVKRYFRDVVREDSHLIGVTQGVVSGPVSNGEGRSGADWRGDFLMIWRQTLSPSRTIVRQRREAWRIDDLGRLVITITSEEAGSAGTSQVLAYRRDKQ